MLLKVIVLLTRKIKEGLLIGSEKAFGVTDVKSQ
jgi:hypothetical protein